MRTTTLGTTGPEIGVIGLGCMGFTFAYDMKTPRDENHSISVIRQALDLGVTLIDTADAYGPHTNEVLVGRALAGGYRERAVLATKVGVVAATAVTTPGRTSPGPSVNGHPDYIRESIDGSLQRLGTDHVDLYQLHRVDPTVPLEDSWGALAETVKQGKARHIGLSEVTVEQIKRAQAIHPVASVQNEVSLWTRDSLAEVLPYCMEQGIAVLPFSPLGRGFLAGRFASSADVPEDDFRRGLPRFQDAAMRTNQVIADGVGLVAERVGATRAQVALAWLVAQGEFVVPIPGTKTPTYLADNAGAADVLLSADDLATLDALPAPAGARY